jgi:hypothetical protein
MPHGGLKHSATAKDMTMYGLEDYTAGAAHHDPALSAVRVTRG